MRIKDIFDGQEGLSAQESAQFNEMNTKYNSSVTLFLSVIAAVLLSGSMLTGYISYTNGAQGVDEFWLVLPYHAACIALSIVIFFVMSVVRKKNLEHHVVSDVVALTQLCLIMMLFLISSHVEIPVTGIKNVNALILAMFAVGFFLRFRITLTLTVEAVFTAATVIFLLIEKKDIPN